MVKRRKKIVRVTERKEKTLPEPDENSKNYIYDDVDQFHRNKDKLFLDKDQHEDDIELDDSEDEEVLGLGSDSDEDSGEEEEEIDEEDDLQESEDENNKEKGLPSDQAWGRKKKEFYDADVDEGDIYASDEEGDLAAEEEEEEALTLQKRMAARLDEEDFYTVEQEEDDSKKEEEKSIVPKDLSALSKNERLRILTKQSPDLLPLMNEYKESLDELKIYYNPLWKLSQEENSKMTVECKKFIQMRHQLLMNYLVNISFYLAMKAKRENLNGHPIADVLYKHRELLSQMKDTHEKLIAEYQEMLEQNDVKMKTAADDDVDDDIAVLRSVENVDVKNKDKSKKKKKKKEKDEIKEENIDEDEELNIDPLEYYNVMKKEAEKKKEFKKLSTQEDVEAGEDVEEFDEDGKRMITYEMSKNKGLTRQKRKELRNPRVKHKMKFKKAKVKHKGQVREIRNERNKYEGESTGIKASLSRSVRIK